MRRYIMMTAAAAAVATLAALSPAAAGAAGHAPRSGSGTLTGAQQAASGAQLWVRRYNGPGKGLDSATSVVVSRTRVFVTGTSAGRKTGPSDYATVAYSAATGRTLWVSRYNGPANGWDEATAMVVNAAGTEVIVTGNSWGGTTQNDYATVAYSAATGRQLWVSRYNGPANGGGQASSIAVNAAGTAVYVTGTSGSNTITGDDYATVAYSAATGRQLWARRYNGPANGEDFAASVAVNPAGTRVFVTGTSPGRIGGGLAHNDYATVAYRAATGKQLWVSRYSLGYENHAVSVAVNPRGAAVYVTGYGYFRRNGAGPAEYATVAYSAATGKRLWARRYNGGPGAISGATAEAMAVNAAGTRVFVTGYRFGKTGANYATVAYSAATGRQLWVRRYSARDRSDVALSVAVSPAGTRVFVTGTSESRTTNNDYATVAYSAATGRQLWARRYNGPANGYDVARSVAVSPAGTRVFVTGNSWGKTTGPDYATVAYRG